MNKEFIEKQKTILLSQLEEIKNSLEEKNKNLGETKEHILSERNAGSDFKSDLANERIMLRMDEQLGYKQSQMLSQIILSLQKIEKGSYGICHHCSNSIGEERLEAIPYVQTCIECQKKLEKDFQKENGNYTHYYWKFIDKIDLGYLLKLPTEVWDKWYGRK